MPHPTLLEWVRVGRLLFLRPDLLAAMREGRVPLRRLDRLARQGLTAATTESDPEPATAALPVANAGSAPHDRSNPEPATADNPETATADNPEPATTPTADPPTRFVDLSFTAPVPAILYLEDSLQLACAMTGTSHGDEEALCALLAEADTECSRNLTPEAARRRFGVRDRRHEPPARPGEPTRPLPHPPLPPLGEPAQRRAALRLHRILVRLLARRDALRRRQEDQLLQWKLDGLHERCGYLNFERFARDLLDLSPSTCADRLRRARDRRRQHPVALARSAGIITTVQEDLLRRLQRRCFVPPSDLEGWITYAARHTVRALRAAVTWARQKVLTDDRSWSLAGCPPPDDVQLRTGNHSLEELVARPGGDELTDALLTWHTSPRGTIRFHLSEETRDELLLQMAAEQDRVRQSARAQGDTPPPRRIPGWLALCRVFHRARAAWKEHYIKLPGAQRRILDRDGWRCAVPDCTQRHNLQVHHIDYRSRGGNDDDSNRVTLCAFHHHHGEHGGLLRVRGKVQPDGSGLTWEMGLDEHGRPHRVYRDEQLLVDRDEESLRCRDGETPLYRHLTRSILAGTVPPVSPTGFRRTALTEPLPPLRNCGPFPIIRLFFSLHRKSRRV